MFCSSRALRSYFGSLHKSPVLPSARTTYLETGISLVELLIGLVIASIVIGATSFLLLAQLRNSARFEEAQKAEENISRVSTLINAESAEGYELASATSLGAAGAGCSPGPSSPTNIMQVNVRDVAVSGAKIDLYATSGSALDRDASIFYYNAADGVYRCGPALYSFGTVYNPFQDGRLNYGAAPSAALIGPGMDLKIDSLGVTTSGGSAFRLNYSISIKDKGYSRSVSAVSGGRFLLNPSWP